MKCVKCKVELEITAAKTQSIDRIFLDVFCPRCHKDGGVVIEVEDIDIDVFL